MVLTETAKRWLIWSGVVTLILALRIGCVLHERSRPSPSKQVVQRPVERDYLVVVPKFHINDRESAQKLVGQTLWVKAGYQAEYFTYPASEKSTTDPPSRQFDSLEKVVVHRIIERVAPSGSREKQVLLLFQKEGKDFATVVGFFDSKEKQYEMLFDDLFYLKDPHDIYNHWSRETWAKIQAHQLEQGMTFAQVALSLGNGNLVTTQAGGVQLYQFNRRPGGEAGKSRVRFSEGRVTEYEIMGKSR